jgi:hypothetical protein
MAYPPAIPPADRVNATPQVDNHPADHNAISAALTDIVNELGPDPSAPDATVTLRLDRMEVAAFLDWIGANGNLQIEARSDVVTTNANGDGTVPFQRAFTTVPVVVVCNGDANLFVGYGLKGTAVGSFNFAAYWLDSGAPAGSVQVRMNWWAIGRR